MANATLPHSHLNLTLPHRSTRAGDSYPPRIPRHTNVRRIGYVIAKYPSQASGEDLARALCLPGGKAAILRASSRLSLGRTRASGGGRAGHVG